MVKKIILKESVEEMTIEEVINKFEKLVYKLSFSWKNKYDLEDVQQVAFLGLVKSFNSYDYKRNVQFITFATITIKNELLMYNKSEKRHTDHDSLNKELHYENKVYEPIDFLESENDYEEIAIANMNYEKFLSKLNEKQKAIIRLKECGKKQREIAKELGCSQSYISRNLNELKKRRWAYESLY